MKCCKMIILIGRYSSSSQDEDINVLSHTERGRYILKEDEIASEDILQRWRIANMFNIVLIYLYESRLLVGKCETSRVGISRVSL